MGKKTKRFADDGWGMWAYGDTQSTLYFNEWINPNGSSYVDIAVRVYNAKNVTYVNCFIPFHVDDTELINFSYMLADTPVLQTIFNANVQVEPGNNQYTSELRYDGRQVSLIRIMRDFTCIRAVEHGTVVTFDFGYIKDYIVSDEAYLIFRVPHKTLNEIFTSQKDILSIPGKLIELIQSPVVSEEFGYAVRINEARRLPEEVGKTEGLYQQKIKKVVITITIPDDYEVNDSACYRIRRFEEDLMKDYVPEGFVYKNAITYQWIDEREEKKKSHYNFYFSIARNMVSRTSVVVYLILLFVTAVLGSAIYDVIKYLCIGGL